MLERYEYPSAAPRPPLLVAHGLFGSARNWNVIAKRLSVDRPVTTVDMRNHGNSFWSDSHSYFDLAGDLAEVIEDIGQSVDLIGHSMGGKAAMAVALQRPDLVRKLVVADIAPVPYTHSQSHLIAAMQRLDLNAVTSRTEADAALSAQVEETSVRAFLLQSLDVKAKTWRLNLTALDTQMEVITGWPEIEASFNGPSLFLSGALSDYVQPEARAIIKRHFPAARFAKIPNAGHWLHAEKPREFEAAVSAFLHQ